jgi:formylglycine-generating enzyme required for sulfatase activity
MKPITILLLFISCAVWAQKKKIPAGYVWVSDYQLLVGEREVSIADWRDFLDANGNDPAMLPTPNRIVATCLYRKKGEEIIRIDEAALYRDTVFLDSPKGKRIHALESCSQMPITGVSYAQAKAYCEWLSDNFADMPRYSGLKLNFRLPVPTEMDSLLNDIFSAWKPGDPDHDTFRKGINQHGCALFNHRHNSWCDANILMKKEFGYGVPMKAGVFFPDTNGLIDLMGNVAEMTSEPGIARGGSCIHTAAECQAGAANTYDGPQFWLGFRVVSTLNK